MLRTQKNVLTVALLPRKGPYHHSTTALKNYEGSSKGMECFGLMECVLQLHNKYDICVEQFVLDDDATTRAYLKHSYQELIDAGRMEPADWPRDKHKRKLDDKGKLPLSHSVIQFVADINHRVRTWGGYLWRLKKKGKKLLR